MLLRTRLLAFMEDNKALRDKASAPAVPAAAVASIQSSLAQLRSDAVSARSAVCHLSSAFADMSATLLSSTSSAAARQAAVQQHMVQQFRVAYEERKRMHNALQELRGNVRVFCRLRPITGTGQRSAVRVGTMETGTPDQVRERCAGSWEVGGYWQGFDGTG